MDEIPEAIDYYKRMKQMGMPISEIMKGFAKRHVEAALKAAANDISEGPYDAMQECIMTSYPLTNIK